LRPLPGPGAAARIPQGNSLGNTGQAGADHEPNALSATEAPNRPAGLFVSPAALATPSRLPPRWPVRRGPTKSAEGRRSIDRRDGNKPLRHKEHQERRPLTDALPDQKSFSESATARKRPTTLCPWCLGGLSSCRTGQIRSEKV